MLTRYACPVCGEEYDDEADAAECCDVDTSPWQCDECDRQHETEEEADAFSVIIHLKPALYLRNLSIKFPFNSIAIKSRGSQGNIITKHAVDRVVREPKNAETAG
jgi:hypothetical protein